MLVVVQKSLWILMLKYHMYNDTMHPRYPILGIPNSNLIVKEIYKLSFSKFSKESKTKSCFLLEMMVYLYKVRWLFTFHDFSTTLMCNFYFILFLILLYFHIITLKFKTIKINILYGTNSKIVKVSAWTCNSWVRYACHAL